ncbi:2'-5' RNA ligase family protein [Mycobacterium sp. Y57]|uniref:2'-5' RNA ligase family protein n=1 Tax=Mycolicibacterium xanthum TaxID=2796469 RepID=UPI001C851FF2|nr:2'-5' RNA ligase family protein [Mycolicibacterium xanthum]MBX7432876.1 2'-5' RNA ligase family protein [Mycolicibacterium xanthum]
MAHSVELVFDPGTEESIRRIWDDLREAGIPSQAPRSRPHTTLTVAELIDPDVEALLAPLATRLPVPCRIGAPVVFGRGKMVLARLLVPTPELLDIHAEVHRICLPYLHPGPMANALPGQWTGHVTVARRIEPAVLGRAVRIAGRPTDIDGSVVGLRRWDGGSKTEFRIGAAPR